MWIICAVLSAFLFATSDALTKKALGLWDEYLIAWIRLVSALPLLIVSLLFIDIPTIDRTFWVATLMALPLEITAVVLYTKALKVSPLTLTMPFLSLTPVFLIVVSYVILREEVSLSGFIGIILIAGGSYTLNIHRAKRSLIEPVRAILKEKGCMMMIAVAFIFSLTSSLGKMAILHSSPLFFGSVYFMLMATIFTPIALKANKKGFYMNKKNIISLIPIGVTYSLMIIFHMIAMSLANVAYMISIKRLSILVSILYGRIMFGEEKIGERTVGSILMFAGFILIVLG